MISLRLILIKKNFNFVHNTISHSILFLSLKLTIFPKKGCLKPHLPLSWSIPSRSVSFICGCGCYKHSNRNNVFSIFYNVEFLYFNRFLQVTPQSSSHQRPLINPYSRIKTLHAHITPTL